MRRVFPSSSRESSLQFSPLPLAGEGRVRAGWFKIALTPALSRKRERGKSCKRERGKRRERESGKSRKREEELQA